MNITMLGGMGSGKTCFMAGINQLFVNSSVEGFKLRPNEKYEDQRVTFELYRILRNLGFVSNNRSLIFPISTEVTVYMPFVLKYNDHTICNFNWIDYKGGLVTDLFGDTGTTEQRASEEVQARILQSDALMVFIDSILLANINRIEHCREVTDINSISIILNEYAQLYPRYNKVITIVLTKCDSNLIDEKYKECNYAKLIEKGRDVASNIIQLAHEKQWQCGMIPVSATGMNNVISEKKDIKGSLFPFSVNSWLTNYPTPYNVDIALLYCITEILKRIRSLSSTELDRISREYSDAVSRNSFIRNIWARMNQQTTPGEMVDKLKLERRLESQSLSRIIRNIETLEQLVRGKVVSL